MFHREELWWRGWGGNHCIPCSIYYHTWHNSHLLLYNSWFLVRDSSTRGKRGKDFSPLPLYEALHGIVNKFHPGSHSSDKLSYSCQDTCLKWVLIKLWNWLSPFLQDNFIGPNTISSVVACCSHSASVLGCENWRLSRLLCLCNVERKTKACGKGSLLFSILSG